jgi:hypothetical protein
MKKIISTIVVMGLLSSLLANAAYAGDRGFNPLWIPVAILATVAAVATTQPEPVVLKQQVTYIEPRHHRHDRNYERRPVNCYHDERERYYEPPRYRYYR